MVDCASVAGSATRSIALMRSSVTVKRNATRISCSCIQTAPGWPSMNADCAASARPENMRATASAPLMPASRPSVCQYCAPPIQPRPSHLREASLPDRAAGAARRNSRRARPPETRARVRRAAGSSHRRTRERPALGGARGLQAGVRLRESYRRLRRHRRREHRTCRAARRQRAPPGQRVE